MMKKLAIPLSLVAVAALAACASPQVQQTSNLESATFVTPVPNSGVRPGSGKVMVLLDPTGPIDGISWQRMTLQMQDGSTQIVDRRGHQVAMGARVQVRPENISTAR